MPDVGHLVDLQLHDTWWVVEVANLGVPTGGSL